MGKAVLQIQGVAGLYGGFYNITVRPLRAVWKARRKRRWAYRSTLSAWCGCIGEECEKTIKMTVS